MLISHSSHAPCLSSGQRVRQQQLTDADLPGPGCSLQQCFHDPQKEVRAVDPPSSWGPGHTMRPAKWGVELHMPQPCFLTHALYTLSKQPWDLPFSHCTRLPSMCCILQLFGNLYFYADHFKIPKTVTTTNKNT